MQPAHDRAGGRAVFLDRDGVLILEEGLVTDPATVHLLPGAAHGVRQLQSHGFLVVVVTNQSVVARGACDEAGVGAVHNRIDDLLVEGGAAPVASYHSCFHHPHATVEQYRSECRCRKPLPGLLLDAAAEHDIDLALSFMVGDRMSDIVAGHRAGCTTILVESGAHRDPPIQSRFHDLSVRADATCADLAAAAEWILRVAA